MGPKGRRYLLNNSLTTLIGSRGCAILISDPGVPPQAARLTPHGGGFLLEDVGGSPTVNSRSVAAPVPLQPGDRVKVGATELVYQGPATPSPAATPPPPVSAAVPKAPVIVSAPPPVVPVAPLSPAVPAIIPKSPVMMPAPLAMAPVAPPPPGLALKNWGSSPPTVEGYVELVDGPHRVEKGGTGAKLAASVALGVVSRGALAMLPFMGRQDVNVWFLRIKEHSSGRLVSVLMRGEPSSMPQMGDFVAVWGPIKDGNVIMRSGYCYTTDSEVRLKT